MLHQFSLKTIVFCHISQDPAKSGSIWASSGLNIDLDNLSSFKKTSSQTAPSIKQLSAAAGPATSRSAQPSQPNYNIGGFSSYSGGPSLGPTSMTMGPAVGMGIGPSAGMGVGPSMGMGSSTGMGMRPSMGMGMQPMMGQSYGYGSPGMMQTYGGYSMGANPPFMGGTMQPRPP